MAIRKYIALLLLCALTSSVCAQVSSAGRSVFSFMSLPASSRINALGGSNASLSDGDVSMAMCNPALLHNETHQVLQRLYTLCESGVLVVDLHTLSRLMRQIISTTTIPYHGEPVERVQVMGVLETRCLDFDHLLILSCNEGNMPKGVNDSSFIPHSIRKAYGLTTVEHKVGIFSYYFYPRIIFKT